MCGISGIASLNNNKEVLKGLPSLLDAIKHRGPDDEGCVFFSKDNFMTTYGNDTPNNVKDATLSYSPKNDLSSLDDSYFLGLGHRRLSIIDLSEYGHQPMCDVSENYWLVFNGEIYNYQEIRTELELLGVKFTTQTDTEVLLNAYIQWNEKCLDKLNGMWSFVIYDRKNNLLFGARDRFGVKPFYYLNDGNTFSFSSELKSLIQVPNYQKEINPKAVYDYLALGKLELEDESFFKGIYELKPAHFFRYDLSTNDLVISKYYELPSNKIWEKFLPTKFNSYKKTVYKEVYEAIRLRLNSQVKVGTCLSGGIDSSVVTCVINDIIKSEKVNQVGEQQEVFTASYPSSSIDESKWAEEVVNATKTNWNQTFPNAKDVELQLEDLVYYQDIPFNTSSTFSQYKVMELVHSKNVKVTLDGQGADELFTGYAPHYVSSIFNALKCFSINSLISNCVVKSSDFSNPKLILSVPIKHFISKNFNSFSIKKLLKIQPELSFIHKRLWGNYSHRFKYRSNFFSSNLNRLLQYQFTNYGLNYLLRTADRNSMRFSVESRMPFADDINLIETVFSISGSYKVRKGLSKYLLREASKSIIPEKIYKRNDKIGFATPEKDWFKELKPYFKKIIFEQQSDEFVDWKGIQDNFESIYENALATGTQRLWRLINFAIWRKVYSI